MSSSYRTIQAIISILQFVSIFTISVDSFRLRSWIVSPFQWMATQAKMAVTLQPFGGQRRKKCTDQYSRF